MFVPVRPLASVTTSTARLLCRVKLERTVLLQLLLGEWVHALAFRHHWPHVSRQLGQADSVVLADVSLHASWRITVLIIATRTAGLWTRHVEVGVHSQLSLGSVHLGHAVLMTRWLKSLTRSIAHLHLHLCKLLTTADSRSLTFSRHRSLNLSSAFCMNSSASALFSMPAINIAMFLSAFSFKGLFILWIISSSRFTLSTSG